MVMFMKAVMKCRSKLFKNIFNKRIICIALIGNFNRMQPTEKQLDATQTLLEKGVELNKLNGDYSLYGHCQYEAINSPGA